MVPQGIERGHKDFQPFALKASKGKAFGSNRLSYCVLVVILFVIFYYPLFGLSAGLNRCLINKLVNISVIILYHIKGSGTLLTSLFDLFKNRALFQSRYLIFPIFNVCNKGFFALIAWNWFTIIQFSTNYFLRATIFVQFIFIIERITTTCN